MLLYVIRELYRYDNAHDHVHTSGGEDPTGIIFPVSQSFLFVGVNELSALCEVRCEWCGETAYSRSL